MNLKVFYINLDRDQDRKQHMEDMLSELGFDYERMRAIEGQLIEIQDYYDDKLALEKNGGSLTTAEIGCAASHREIYRRIVREQIPYTLVFEDDIVVVKNFKQIIDLVITKNSNRSRWEYLTFDYAESGSIFLRRWYSSVRLYYQRHVQEKNLSIKIFYILITLTKLCYLAPMTYIETMRNTYFKRRAVGKAVTFWRPLYFMGCYLITLEGAKKLLKLSEPRIIYPADRLPNQARFSEGLGFQAYTPISAKQLRRRFGSNISGVNFDENYKETEL